MLFAFKERPIIGQAKQRPYYLPVTADIASANSKSYFHGGVLVLALGLGLV